MRSSGSATGSAAVATALRKRGRTGAGAEIVVIADHKHLRTSIAEIGQALEPVSAPARVAGAWLTIPKGAELLRGEWGGKLDKSLLIRTARDIAESLVARLPALPAARPGPRAGHRHRRRRRAAGVRGHLGRGPRPRHAAARGFPPLAAPSGATSPRRTRATPPDCPASTRPPARPARSATAAARCRPPGTGRLAAAPEPGRPAAAPTARPSRQRRARARPAGAVTSGGP